MSPQPAEVLIDHQRRPDGNCLCGGLRFGASHAEHLIEALNDAGYVIVTETTMRRILSY